MFETALCPFESQDITVTGTSARTAAAISTRRVRVKATGTMRIRFGGATVVALATDMLMEAGDIEYFDLMAAGHTHVAAIGSGTLNVTAM